MDRARDLYARALDKSPGNADVLNNFGSWHYARGEFDEARKYWLRAAAADPRNPSPLNNVAGLEINASRFDEAERLLRRAIELDPGYGDARINLSIILMTRQEIDRAREELELATADRRTGSGAWAKLGALELENMVYVAETIAASAVSRKESRGAHTCKDFPHRDDQNYLYHTLCYQDAAAPRLDKKEVTLGTWVPEERKY